MGWGGFWSLEAQLVAATTTRRNLLFMANEERGTCCQPRGLQQSSFTIKWISLHCWPTGEIRASLVMALPLLSSLVSLSFIFKYFLSFSTIDIFTATASSDLIHQDQSESHNSVRYNNTRTPDEHRCHFISWHLTIWQRHIPGLRCHDTQYNFSTPINSCTQTNSPLNSHNQNISLKSTSKVISNVSFS